MSEPKPLHVVVDGATGYLGTHLVQKLCSDSFRVRALVHPLAKRVDLDFLSSLGAKVFTGDLTKPGQSEVRNALTGVDTVVHLIGSVAPKKNERLEDLHVGQTRNLVQACIQAGVGRIVMITSLGASPDANNSYQKTKWMAEEEVRKSGLEYVILRPPLLVGKVIGSRDSKLVQRYRQMITDKKVVPLINGGTNKVQPLFIGDLVEAIVLCIEATADSVLYKELELGGPEIMTMKEFIELLMDAIGTHKPVVPLHPGLAKLVALLCTATQEVPIVSNDQVKLAQLDNIASANAFPSVLNIELMPVKKALESYNTRSAPVATPNMTL